MGALVPETSCCILICKILKLNKTRHFSSGTSAAIQRWVYKLWSLNYFTPPVILVTFYCHQGYTSGAEFSIWWQSGPGSIPVTLIIYLSIGKPVPVCPFQYNAIKRQGEETWVSYWFITWDKFLCGPIFSGLVCASAGLDVYLSWASLIFGLSGGTFYILIRNLVLLAKVSDPGNSLFSLSKPLEKKWNL